MVLAQPLNQLSKAKDSIQSRRIHGGGKRMA
jgi:hypothetical protein